MWLQSCARHSAVPLSAVVPTDVHPRGPLALRDVHSEILSRVVLEPGAENLDRVPTSPATPSPVPLWAGANPLTVERRGQEESTHLPGQSQGSSPASWLPVQSPGPWARAEPPPSRTLWRNVWGQEVSPGRLSLEASVTQHARACAPPP